MESIFPKDFLATRDWDMQSLKAVIELAERFKLERQAGYMHNQLLAARTLFSIFYNASTRTRTSFMSAMTQLGGETHTLNPSALQESIGEVIKDTAGVLSRYGDAISVRHCFIRPEDKYGDSHKILETYAEHSGVPVLNMESDMFHPCQVMADWQTIRQNFGNDLKGKKIVVSWAYGKYIRPVAVPQSLVSLMTRLGMDVTLAHPKGFELDPDVIKEAEEAAVKSGGKFTITNDMKEGMKDAHVIYAKNWGSLKAMPDMDKAAEMQQPHKDWIVDAKKMKLANPEAIYMHCLPVDRGLEVTDDVIDGPQSRTMDQAENRLHAQKALLTLMINNRGKGV
ncbi:MAG: N-acetylornithine carbamoyltransferase [Candidatus Heimdallarchaeota archaeon]|nr:N-acetylornithine carbamoyltransferase [Candidatus Heimdallarchaeota archaeon]